MEERILKKMSIILVVITMLINTATYSYLPLKVAIHFNNSGAGDNYISRTIFVIMAPIVIALFFALSYVYKNKKRTFALAEVVIFIANLWTIFIQLKL